MYSRYRYLLLGCTALIAANPALTLAQAIPNTARPSTIEQQYKIQDERPEVGGAPLITIPEQGAKPIKSDVSFVLKDIKLEGDSAFPQDELRDLYKDKLGQKISLADLNGIAEAITRYYRNHGYILTRAVVPPQHAKDGVITIRIVEGFVDNIVVQGDKAEDPQIQAYADKIRASKPLDSKLLERYLLLMNDLPGVEARAVLKPSANVTGASDVVITVKRKTVEGSLTLDNRGSRYIGPLQDSATVAFNNLIGWDDQTQFRVANTPVNPEDLKYLEIRHEEQLGSEGLKMVVAASDVQTKPRYTLGDIDLEGVSNSASVGLSYPMLRSRQSNWFLNSDFTIRNVNVSTFAGNFYVDKTRVLTLGTAYDFIDSSSAITRVEGGIGQGFGIGTDDNDGDVRSRANADTAFTKFTAKTTRIQPIGGAWSIFGEVAGQYSQQSLVASEEFALGGQEIGSAYDSAEITGDSGLGGRAELQYNKTQETQFFSQYQLYGFIDGGEVWNVDAVAGTESEKSALASTGLGARFNLLESVSGSVEGSLPIRRKVAAYGEDGAAPRAFFGLQYRF